MSLFNESDIEYPLTVMVKRPQENFSDSGNYEESLVTVLEGLTVDIQLSLKVRKLISEDEKGITDNTVWIMFCKPPVSIQTGDIVSDGTRTFVVDAVGEWGSHTECVMRKEDG